MQAIILITKISLFEMSPKRSRDQLIQVGATALAFMGSPIYRIFPLMSSALETLSGLVIFSQLE